MSTVLLVAGREVRERLRSKAFRISTAILVVGALAAVLVPTLVGGSGGASYTVGLVAPTPAGVAESVRAAAPALGDDVRLVVRDVPSAAAGAAGLREDELDVVLVGGVDVQVRSEPDAGSRLSTLVAILQRTASLARSLEVAGVPPDAAREALTRAPAVPVTSVAPEPERRDEGRGVAYVGVLVLYLALIFTGLSVASGVAEEKSTRVAELLVAAIPPRRLLAGKVLGIGAAGLAQLLAVAVPTVAALLALDQADVPSGSFATVLWTLVWFVLGYALYGCLYAAAGALAGRQEDTQSTTAPVTVLLVASYVVALPVIDDPGTRFADAISLVPPFSPVTVPARLALGEEPAWHLALAIVLSLATSALLVQLAGRIYVGAVLRFGQRTPLVRAWRLGRD